MEDLTDLGLACADLLDIEEFKKLARQIESANIFGELIRSLQDRAKVMSRIFEIPLHLFEE